MSPGRLRQQPHKLCPDALEGHLDDGQRYQRTGGGVLGDVTWQVGQAWQNRFTSASNTGQWKRSRWMVFVAPRCPAKGCECASSSTVSVFVRGTPNNNFSSLLR